MRLNFPKELNFYISMMEHHQENFVKKNIKRGLFLYHFSAEAQICSRDEEGIRGREGVWRN
jgi:hypothetical protein